MSQEFVALVPVKPWSAAKSRLGSLGPAARRDLALAFARDTVAALLATQAVRRVVLVGDLEPELVPLIGAAELLPDAGGLNSSLVAAAAMMAQREIPLQPLAICADLPALRPDDLASALRHASGVGPAFVRDLSGSGTTAYTAPAPDFAPRFGLDSARQHLGAGAVELDAAPSLRCDVDDVGALAEARRLGLGAYTLAALATRADVWSTPADSP